jgi:hypothetical protein
MEYVAILLGTVQVLTGIVVWFMKTAYEDLKEKNKELENSITHVKDTYFKKEDFREFKDELWTRLDKMENSFDRKLQELKK